MEKNKKFLTILLLMLGIGLTFSDEISAQRKGKGSSKSKSKAQSKAKKKSNSSSSRETSERETETTYTTEEDINRAAGSRTNTSTTTSSSSSSATAYNEDEEIEILTSQLENCTRTPCSDVVEFDNCFKPGKVDTYLKTGECATYIDNASNENIALKAQNNLKEVIKNKLKTACTEAGGKVSGSTCKFEIYYQAMGPDGQKSRIGKNEYTLGSTFTCNYANFGLSPSDLEYKEEKSTEDKLAMITAGIEMGMGLLNTGLQIAETVKTSRQLKEKSRYMHDAWYKFDGTNLTVTDKIGAEYQYGSKGKKKDLEEEYNCSETSQNPCCSEFGGDFKYEKITTDEEGSYYARCKNDNVDSTKPYPKDTPNNICNADYKAKNGEKIECYTYIEKATEIKVAEKLSELMRTIGDLESKRKASERAQREIAKLDRNSQLDDYANEYNEYQTDNNWNYNNCESVGGYLGDVSNNITLDPSNIGSFMRNKHPAKDINTGKCECIGNSQGSYCSCLTIGSDDKCEFNKSSSRWGIKPSATINGERIKKQLDDYNFDENGQVSMIDENNSTAQKLDAVYKYHENKVSDYTKTLNTYNTNQTKLNEAKKEMEELREKSNSSITNIASQATQTLMGSGMTLMTTAIAANQKKGTMTGMCYLGDPKNGGTPLTNEGEAKKLTWKLFYD